MIVHKPDEPCLWGEWRANDFSIVTQKQPSALAGCCKTAVEAVSERDGAGCTAAGAGTIEGDRAKPAPMQVRSQDAHQRALLPHQLLRRLPCKRKPPEGLIRVSWGDEPRPWRLGPCSVGALHGLNPWRHSRHTFG